MINIDHYAYTSYLKNINPFEKMFFAVFTLGVCLWANSVVVSILILLFMTWQTVVKGKTPARDYLKLMMIPTTFLLFGVLAVAIEVSIHPQQESASFQVLGLYFSVTEAGLGMATLLFFRALGAVSCLYYLALSTPMVDILSALRKLRCPTLFIELMSLIYRYIFVLLETAQTIQLAQQARLGYANIFVSYRSLGTLVSTLFMRAYKRSDDLFTALEARGYTGSLLVLEETTPIRWQSFVKAGALNGLLILINILVVGR